MNKSLIRSMATVGLCASAFVTTGVQAAYTVTDMPGVQSGYPANITEWLATPGDFTWRPVNVRPGKHPDRPDGVIYIFPDADYANAWWDGTGTMPDGIPDTAVGYVHWALDNGSGEFPGIMGITDDYTFKTNNCLMSSGTEIPVDQDENGIYDDNVFIDKTCGNPQGSSKRFKFMVLQADEPIDLVFNTTKQDLTYSNYDEVDVQDDIFRIYRYIMKWGNGTGTDVIDAAKPDGSGGTGAAITRDGDRLVGFSVELGTGVGGAFTPFADGTTGDETTDAGIGYELRVCIPDKYFNEDSGQTTPGTSDCPAGETELWLENEYATFSPSMFSLTTDKRTTPVGGYWDKRPSGIFAPPTSLQTHQKIDSGDLAYEANVNTDGSDYGDWVADGQIGQTLTNYYNIRAAQASAATPAFPAGNIFGYQMYYGVISDGDTGNLPAGIYIDADGDPSTEGKVHAWWDGLNFRWGIDPDMDGVTTGDTDSPDAWSIVDPADLVEMTLRPLDEDQTLPPPRYEIGYMDDLGGLNVDTFIKITETFDVDTYDSFTVRLTAQSTTDAGLVPGDPGVDDGPWVVSDGAGGTENNVPSLEEVLDQNVGSEGVVAIIAGDAGEPLHLAVADEDLNGSTSVDVTVTNLRTDEVETVTLDLVSGLNNSFEGTFNTTNNPDTGADDDTLNVIAGDVVRVTYEDADDGTGNPATVEAEATISGSISTSGGSSGGGCTIGTGSAWNITMPAILLALLGYGLIRRRRKQ